MRSRLMLSSPIPTLVRTLFVMYPGWVLMTNNSSEFQISEYVSIILSFLSMKYTTGVFIYRGSRKPTVPRLNCNKHGKMLGLFKGFYFTFWELSLFKFCGVWDVWRLEFGTQNIFLVSWQLVRDKWMMNKERWTRKQSGTLDFLETD